MRNRLAFIAALAAILAFPVGAASARSGGGHGGGGHGGGGHGGGARMGAVHFGGGGGMRVGGGRVFVGGARVGRVGGGVAFRSAVYPRYRYAGHVYPRRRVIVRRFHVGPFYTAGLYSCWRWRWTPLGYRRTWICGYPYGPYYGGYYGYYPHY